MRQTMISVLQRRLQNLSGQLFAKHSHIGPVTRNIFIDMAKGEFSAEAVAFNRFEVGISMNPHPAKREKGGEDAATITENFIALADGVGGWADSGVDPAKYSRQLCKNI